MLLGRSLEGLALVGWLGANYLACLRLGRWFPGPAAAWRRRLDRHGSRLTTAYIRRRGGMLIKIGQFVATRPDFFPLAYVDACAPLRDHATPRPFPEIAAALDLAYEGRPGEHLQRVDPEPLAAASFGQVHRAWLNDGTLVAVKIQYPGLAATVARDLALVRLTLRLFRRALHGWPLDLIYDEIQRTAREEQDYLHEGSAADRLRPVLAEAGVSVPAVRWAHTREKVLVMEFAGGTTLAQFDITTLAERERQELSDRVIDGFLRMLLDESFFHADPHAGNLLYEPREGAPARLWLIDFGMTAEITTRESALYRRFLACLKTNDVDGMVEVLTTLGFVLPTADRAHLRGLAREIYDSLGHLDPQSFKGSLRQAELGARINEFMRRVEGIAFPQHTLLLSRATGLIEGLCMLLVPGSNILDLVRARIKGRIGLRQQFARWRDEVGEVWSSLRSLPDRLEAAVAQRSEQRVLTPVVAAILLLAAIGLPEGTARNVAAVCAGLAVVIGLRRPRD